MFDLAAVEAVVHPAFLVRTDYTRHTIRVFGELDVSSAPELLRAAEAFDPWTTVSVCLESLASIDASGLRALATLRERHGAAGGGVTVINAPDLIARAVAASPARVRPGRDPLEAA